MAGKLRNRRQDYCGYIAPNEQAIHPQAGGFPADSIAEVKTRIDPTTAELSQAGLTGLTRTE